MRIVILDNYVFMFQSNDADDKVIKQRYYGCNAEEKVAMKCYYGCCNEKRDNKQCLLDTPRRVTVNNKKTLINM